MRTWILVEWRVVAGARAKLRLELGHDLAVVSSGQRMIGRLGTLGNGVVTAVGRARGTPAQVGRLQRLGRLRLLGILDLQQLLDHVGLMVGLIRGWVETHGLVAMVMGLGHQVAGTRTGRGGALPKETTQILLDGPIGPTIALGVGP